MESNKSKEELVRNRTFSIEAGLHYFTSISECGSNFRDTYRPEFPEQRRIALLGHYAFCLLQIAEHEKEIADTESELGISADSRIKALCQRIDSLKRCLDEFKANALQREA